MAMTNAYVVNNSHLDILSQTVWTNRNIAQNFLNSGSSPIDAVLRLYRLPFNVNGSNTRNILLGNISVDLSGADFAKDVSGALSWRGLTFKIPGGSIILPNDNYLDYAGYTSAQIYLPFYGIVSIDINSIAQIIETSRDVELQCWVDLYTGNFTYFLLGYTNNIIGQWSGNMAYDYPISGSRSNGFEAVRGVLTGIGMASAGIASGSAPAVLGAGANILGGMQAAQTPPIMTSGAMQGNGAWSSAVVNLGVSGSGLVPALILRQPIDITASGYNYAYGYQTYKYGQLSLWLGEGLCVFDKVHLQNVSSHIVYNDSHYSASATIEEIKEIEDLLKEGVFI